MATISYVLERKIDTESKNLKQKLESQLCKDIYKLYSQSIFTDIYINLGNENCIIKSHRCILQTRVPTFYNTYCTRPDLINYVPVKELQIFIKEIYCNSEIREKEEKILQYIDSVFADRDRIQCSSIAKSDVTQSKHRFLSDISKFNALNASHVNHLYFRSNSDNSLYYSLVDRSLVLSDYSDVNEESTEMSSCVERLELSASDKSSVSQTNTSVEGDVTCVRKDGLQTCPIVQHLTFKDLSESQEEQATTSIDANCKKKSKVLKCFIDASDLIDESNNDVNNLESLKADLTEQKRENNEPLHQFVDGKICEYNSARSFQDEASVVKTNFQDPTEATVACCISPCGDASFKSVVQLEDSDVGVEGSISASRETSFKSVVQLEDEKIMSSATVDCCSTFISEEEKNKKKPELFSGIPSPRNSPVDQRIKANGVNACYSKPETIVIDESFYDRFQVHGEVNEANMTTELDSSNQCSGDSFNNHVKAGNVGCNSSKVTSTCNENISTPSSLTVTSEEMFSTNIAKLRDAFPLFKIHLNVKYECAKSNHEYSTSEVEHLKEFDELLLRDVKFQFLQLCLEEILLSKTASKVEVAMYKFLMKQYENKYGYAKVSAYVRSLMKYLLKGKSGFEEETDDCEVDDLFKKLLSFKTPQSRMNSKNFEPSRESVTNSKSCGFFIDFNDTTTNPVANIKEKTLPPKQLFSMFIDFGNSTDSDSSFEVRNKFERRKKQYMSKIEKSRDLPSSTISLRDADENRRLEKISQRTSDTKQEFAPSSVNVVRRQKNTKTSSVEIRRSWDVEKKNEINTNTINKHKRSHRVSEKKALVEKHVEEVPSGSELPSIGNADSTNELAVNGESEIPNSISYSEHELESKMASTSSNSKTCPKSPLNSEESTDKVIANNFVKLSDLDNDPKPSPSTEPWPSIRMTKSVTTTDSNWLESKFLNRSVNSRSLSRIFPDLSASVLSKPSSDVDDTTVSSFSSMQSSSAVSTCESNLDLSNTLIKTGSNTLGQDLLRMFLEEISTDVVVEVAGRRIKAHKCILTSRCQYFAALLSGGWVESAGNVLSIHGFSYSVVHFSLCYIYSGDVEVPQSMNVVELATLADYLCLEGLKEIVSSFLKNKYCHVFHKPCNICSVGVLECLPIAINYGLDELQRKSLRWITKHFVRLWCTKGFASLPLELIEKCCNQHIVNMTVNNVFETLMNCDKLFSVIPQTRWAEPCYVVTKKLHDFCIKFLANHFVDFLKCDSFTSFASNRTWGIVIIDEKTQHVCSKMRPDQLCLSYDYVSGQHALATATHKNEELIELLSRVRNRLETSLVKCALQAVQCSAWFLMKAELRSHIQTSAGLTFLPTETKRRPDSAKTGQSVASCGSRATDLEQVKSAINRQHKQNNVRYSEPRETRQSVHQRLSSIKPRSSSVKQNGIRNKENERARNSLSSSKSPYRHKYANVKSRYMDQKSDKNASETTPSEASETEKKAAANKRPSKSLVSSVHMSPAIRPTDRAISLSKIPVSVRTSQKHRESDKDTTSESDNGARSDNMRETASDRSVKKTSDSVPSKGSKTSRTKQFQATRKSYSGPSQTRNDDEKPSGNLNRSYMKTTQSASTKAKSLVNGSRHSDRNQNCIADRKSNCETRGSLKDCSPPDTKCLAGPSSKNISSQNVVARPNIPLRRDGTFCIEEPTVLRKHSRNSDHADVV